VNDYIPRPTYEEPVHRELSIKEHVNRLNPIDIETYKISDCSGRALNHIDSRTLSTLRANSRVQEDSSEFNIQQLLKRNSYGNSIDESTKLKANSKVMEFFNEIKEVIV
jgi:hypothetical protein